jgi:cytoplasmic iron level regulating protein YaaA (DUF328/UPF0246 family)
MGIQSKLFGVLRKLGLTTKYALEQKKKDPN